MSEDKALTTMIEELVDKSTTNVEEIHRAVAELPLSVLERLGVFEHIAGEVRDIQVASIGAVYDMVRDLNHRVLRLTGEILDRVDRPVAEQA